ncbi:ficolin-2-like [Branchiostoma floridae]|uniref:Ficolin-2-like n=1 Tax=Branchiostoma floridae TaxID=7739 RepID=A0A9J7MDK1_BRAFL|nr:ficolin-2-like [Branchiostoma floridae]
MVGLAVTTTIILLVASLANAAPASKTKESYVESEIQVVSARIKKSRAILHDIYDDLKTIGKRVKDFDINMERLTVNVTALDTFYSNFQWTPVRQITGTAATGGATGSVAVQDIRDCTDVLASGNTQSGVYSVTLASQESPTRLYCRMEGDDAWNIIQRRSDDSVDFDRSWDTYKNGFGDLEGSFWFGNDNIHLLTNQGQYRLRVRLERFNGQSAHADYDLFRIKDEENKYQLEIGYFTGGGAGDCLYYHAYMSFSTYDQDNDHVPWGWSCAENLHGGFWFKDCGQCNPNGMYYNSAVRDSGATSWNPWTYYMESLKFVEFGLLRRWID